LVATATPVNDVVFEFTTFVPEIAAKTVIIILKKEIKLLQDNLILNRILNIKH